MFLRLRAYQRSAVAERTKAGGGMSMKFVLMAFGAAAGIITGSTLALAETSVAPAEEEKIKATIESFG